MKIGEAAEQLKTSVQTLRFYESSGLITSKRSSGGTRLFDEEDMGRIRVIQTLSTLGIPHRQLKALADTRALSKTGNESSRKVVSQLEDMIDTLHNLKLLIENTIGDIERTEAFVKQCHGCKRQPRKDICAKCDITKNKADLKIIDLIWDQSHD